MAVNVGAARTGGGGYVGGIAGNANADFAEPVAPLHAEDGGYCDHGAANPGGISVYAEIFRARGIAWFCERIRRLPVRAKEKNVTAGLAIRRNRYHFIGR